MKNAYLAVLTIGSILAVGLAFAGGQYDPGVSDTEIKIGNTMPYSSRCRVRFYRIRPFGATLGRNWSAKAGAKKGVPLLDWLLRSVNRLPFLEISQNRETGESPEEMPASVTLLGYAGLGGFSDLLHRSFSVCRLQHQIGQER